MIAFTTVSEWRNSVILVFMHLVFCDGNGHVYAYYSSGSGEMKRVYTERTESSNEENRNIEKKKGSWLYIKTKHNKKWIIIWTNLMKYQLWKEDTLSCRWWQCLNEWKKKSCNIYTITFQIRLFYCNYPCFL